MYYTLYRKNNLFTVLDEKASFEEYNKVEKSTVGSKVRFQTIPVLNEKISLSFN